MWWDVSYSRAVTRWLHTLGARIALSFSNALARLIASLEYGVTGFDPVTWLLVPGLLSATTVLTSWRPARRALRVDPVAVLREE
jgi:putative ABC transport system permease protein